MLNGTALASVCLKTAAQTDDLEGDLTPILQDGSGFTELLTIRSFLMREEAVGLEGPTLAPRSV